MSDATSPPNEALLQAKAKAHRLAAAFETVFSKGSRRTAEQRLVVEHLSKHAEDGLNCYRFNEAHDGVALIAKGLWRDGAQSVLRVIERQLSLAAKPLPKDKPQTIR